MNFTKDELSNLEWWRGFLSFLVFSAHIAQIIWFPIYGNNGLLAILMSGLANLSVVFFFVISGVLIFFSAQKLSINHIFDWKKFLINRMTRIFPSYYLALIICLVLMIFLTVLNGNSFQIDNGRLENLARNDFSAGTLDFVKSLFLINSDILNLNGPLWSLFIEWWLYISAMFLFLFFSNGGSRQFKFLYFLLFIFSLYLSSVGLGKRVVPYIIIWYFGGIYTIYLHNKNRLFNVLVFLSLIFIAVLIKFFGIEVLNVRSGNGLGYSCFQILISVFFVLIGFKFSGKYFFKKIAPFSYTLYIIHFPITMFCFAIFIKYFTLNNLSAIVLTIFVLFLNLLISKNIAVIFEDKFRFRVLFEKLRGLRSFR